MGKSQRDKGKRGEREVAKILKDHGYADARRGQQYKGSAGSPDVEGLPGFHIEVKRTEVLRLTDFFEQAIEESEYDEIPVVVWRRDHGKWFAILGFEDFIEAVKPYADNGR